MLQGVDVSTTYHAFVSKLDIIMQSLMDNVIVNKKAKGRGSITRADVEAIFGD